MKNLLIACCIILSLSFLLSCDKNRTSLRVGCRDRNATNYDSQAEKDCNGCCTFPPEGALLFWTNNPSILLSCGTVTVKLSNGMQSNITGYYFTAPANCVSQFGGYFLLKEGTYTYQILTNGCTIPGGTVSVIGNRCNFARIN